MMVLSQTAEYALRAMAQLAVLPEGESVRGKDLAALTDIPSHYLSKILRLLVEAKLLTGERGHGGGFRLARPAAEIRFCDIFEAVGVSPETNRCSFGLGACNPKHPCLLHGVVSGLNDAVADWCETTTLADLAARPGTVERYARQLDALRRR